MIRSILFFICFFCPCLGFAQIEDILSQENRSVLTGEETNQVFAGQPVVLIEKSPDAEQEKFEEKALYLPPPDLKNEIELTIKTPFSHDRQASFIDHTTDWVSYVQVLDSETVRVTEEIQFITTESGQRFNRRFANHLTNKEGRTLTPNRRFLSVKRDGKDIAVQIDETDTGTTVSDTKELSVGVHRYTIQYLISGILVQDSSVADMIFPMTDNMWSLPIERLTALITFPKKIPVYTREFLFGINNQVIPENGRVTQDVTGTVLYQTTHPLPAYADVRLHMVLDARQIPQALANVDYRILMGTVFLIVLMVYALLSIAVCRYRRWKNILWAGRKLNPFLWRRVIFSALSISEQQSTCSDVIERQSKLNRFPMIQYALAFLRFNREYLVGILLMIWCMHLLAAYWNTPLSFGIRAFILGISLLGLILIHYFGTRIELLRLRRLFKEELLSSPRGLNLAPRDIPPYFIRAVCLGFGPAWADRLVANNPAYRKLDFLQGKENG